MSRTWHRWQTAREPHSCEECGRRIGVGERYAKHAGVWEGQFWSGMKGCGHCERFRQLWVYTLNPYEWTYGCLLEQIDLAEARPFRVEEKAFLRAYRWSRRRWRREDGTLVAFRLAGLPEAEPS